MLKIRKSLLAACRKSLSLVTISYLMVTAYSSAIAMPNQWQEDSGRDRAMQLCQKLTFDNKINDCMIAIRNVRTFDQKALGVCDSITFDSNLVSCLQTIGDKIYTNGEASICQQKTFDSEKVRCLNITGAPAGQFPQPIPQPIPSCQEDQTLRINVTIQLKDIDQNLRRGNIQLAGSLVIRLIEKLERGQSINNGRR